MPKLTKNKKAPQMQSFSNVRKVLLLKNYFSILKKSTILKNLTVQDKKKIKKYNMYFLNSNKSKESCFK